MLRTNPSSVFLTGSIALFLAIAGFGCSDPDEVSGNNGVFNNASNNGASNNGASNNGASNNGASNNGATNNGASNNGATNNGATNNGATNNGGTNNANNNGDAEAQQCESSGGRWDETSCGHWTCGLPPACQAIIPGCDCGAGHIFDPTVGCTPSEMCAPMDDADLCAVSGGTWDEGSCGHWLCGEQPACDALIPGCNCGLGQIFEPRLGCVASDRCTGPTEELLCGDTGGRWDEGSCGHWICGEQPACRALIPGCDCGAGNVFDPALGCIASAVCAPNGEALLCGETGGAWDEGSCGHWVCGESPLCDAIIPGCNCGLGMVFDTTAGCVASRVCDTDPNTALCEQSEGRWDPFSCGHYVCGERPGCRAIIPGCNCGDGRVFIDGEGCADSNLCATSTEAAVCEATRGIWDEGSCGHWECGQPPACLALIPGCNCGPGRNFDTRFGCFVSELCDPADPAAAICQLTGGQWDPTACGDEFCGAAPDCDAIIPGCACGPGMTFTAEAGCAASRACHTPPQELCEGTRGTWDPTACGDDVCGAAPDCDAIIPGCHCGDTRVFHGNVGCVTSDQCNACPDPRDPAVTYTSRDPAVCAQIRIACPDGQTLFSSECGCGCEAR